MTAYHNISYCCLWYVVILLLYGNAFILLAPLALGQNVHNTAILPSTKKVQIDGEIGKEEWGDASKINFSSPVTSREYILVYLKYDIFEKAIDGAFIIPDKSPFMAVKRPDQIGFLFDTGHSKSNSTQLTDHQIVFTRGQRGEYYLGDNSSKYYFRSVYNVTTPNHTMLAIKPLSNVSFYIIPNTLNNTAWQGEFKIRFYENPKVTVLRYHRKTLL